MPWSHPDHQTSAVAAISRGLIAAELDVLADTPEPAQSSEHQARVAILAVDDRLPKFDARRFGTVQDAVNAASAAGGGTVHLSPGRTVITEPIRIGEQAGASFWVSLVGAGMGVSVLENIGTGPAIVVSQPGTNLHYGARGPKFEDFTIEGSGGGTGQHGIHIGQTYDNIVIRRVRIGKAGVAGPDGHGIYIFDTLNVHIENCVVDKCGGSGIKFVSGEYPGPNACSIVGTSSRENGEHGFHLVDGGSPSYNVYWKGGILESNKGAAFVVDQGMNVEIDGPHIEANGAESVMSSYMGVVRNIVPVSTGLYVDGMSVVVENSSFAPSTQLRIAPGNRGVRLVNVRYEESLQDAIDDRGKGTVYRAVSPLTGNQDTGFDVVPRGRYGIPPLNGAPSKRGMLARVEGGAFQDRLLYGRKRKGGVEWVDLDVTIVGGPPTDADFQPMSGPSGPAPAIGARAVDPVGKRLYVKTGVDEWSSVQLEVMQGA